MMARVNPPAYMHRLGLAKNPVCGAVSGCRSASPNAELELSSSQGAANAIESSRGAMAGGWGATDRPSGWMKGVGKGGEGKRSLSGRRDQKLRSSVLLSASLGRVQAPTPRNFSLCQPAQGSGYTAQTHLVEALYPAVRPGRITLRESARVTCVRNLPT